MANDFGPDDLREVWCGQKVEHTQMTVEELREKARKLQRRFLFGNLLGYVAGTCAVAFSAFSMGHYPPLMRAGAWLLIAGTINAAYQNHRRVSAKTPSADAAPASWLEFHRRQLERRRDALRGVWVWNFGPLIPGLVLLFLGASLANPAHLRHALKFDALFAPVVALSFYLASRLTRIAARDFQRQIDELNAMRSGD
jgi:hypothetical protein